MHVFLGKKYFLIKPSMRNLQLSVGLDAEEQKNELSNFVKRS